MKLDEVPVEGVLVDTDDDTDEKVDDGFCDAGDSEAEALELLTDLYTTVDSLVKDGGINIRRVTRMRRVELEELLERINTFLDDFEI